MLCKLFAWLTVIAVTIAVTTATASADPKHHGYTVKQHHRHHVQHIWLDADESIYPAIHKASNIFNVSQDLLRTIVSREGGNINPRTLHSSLCSGSGKGWNTLGSYAFGAFQFMLDSKSNACTGNWGTFDAYAQTAFNSAKKRGYTIPHRFMTPASNIGQAITAAYMIANGGLHHWCASMC